MTRFLFYSLLNCSPFSRQLHSPYNDDDLWADIDEVNSDSTTGYNQGPDESDQDYTERQEDLESYAEYGL